MSGDCLYLIQGTDVSGAERMHAALISADENALVCCPADSRSEEFAIECGADVVDLPHRTLRHSGGRLETFRSVARGLRTVRDLRVVLRRHPGRKIVFCTSIRPGMLASLAAVGLGRKVFWAVPDFLPPWPLKQVVRALAWLGADGGLCLSEAIARDFAGRSKRLRDLAPVVHPGLSLGSHGQREGRDRPPRVAIVGHVSEVKKTGLAIDIARLVARELPDFRLRVIGSPQFRSEDFDLHRRLQSETAVDPLLSKCVEWQGFVRDVVESLLECSVLLHCRPDEPFGIALIEGMAAGLPVVAPAQAGPLEIVDPGVTGYLYPPGDAEAAACRLIALLRDPQEANRMGTAGREAVVRRFAIDRQVSATERLLEAMR